MIWKNYLQWMGSFPYYLSSEISAMGTCTLLSLWCLFFSLTVSLEQSQFKAMIWAIREPMPWPESTAQRDRRQSRKSHSPLFCKSYPRKSFQDLPELSLCFRDPLYVKFLSSQIYNGNTTLEKPSPVPHVRTAVLKNSISQDRSYFFTHQSPPWWKQNFILKATCLQAQDTKCLSLYPTPQAHAHMHFEWGFFMVAYFHKVLNLVTRSF